MKLVINDNNILYFQFLIKGYISSPFANKK